LFVPRLVFSCLLCCNNAMKNTIKVERAKLSMTQADLAQQVQVSKQTINSIETGRFVPSTVITLKIARFFKVSVESIFELEEGD
jgi:putative transcriptional regulator